MADSSGHEASEVLEEHAEGDLKGIFEDIKKSMRVPFVPLAFGLLAQEPDYLRVAWRQIHTNVQTTYFENRADDIRRLAVMSVADMATVRTPVVSEDIVGVLRTLHYVTPKVLLTIDALRAALSGQVPRVVMLSAAERRQIPDRIPPEMVKPALVDAATTDPRLRAVFDAIRSASALGRVSAEYRAVAAWPDYLEGWWAAVSERRTLPEYRRAVREVKWMADEAVLGLPFRVEATSHTLRHAGLTESQIDAVRGMLDGLSKDLAESVVNIARSFTAIEGQGAAAETPYPISSG